MMVAKKTIAFFTGSIFNNFRIRYAYHKNTTWNAKSQEHMRISDLKENARHYKR